VPAQDDGDGDEADGDDGRPRRKRAPRQDLN
jgi:hypothetical protein